MIIVIVEVPVFIVCSIRATLGVNNCQRVSELFLCLFLQNLRDTLFSTAMLLFLTALWNID